MKSINLTALKKHGKVYEDGELFLERGKKKLTQSFFSQVIFLFLFGNVAARVHLPVLITPCFASSEQFGCLVWSHSETHLLYVAEKKRPKAESFFQVCVQNLFSTLDFLEQRTAHQLSELLDFT